MSTHIRDIETKFTKKTRRTYAESVAAQTRQQTDKHLSQTAGGGAIDDDTPALRLFALLELIAAQDAFVSLPSLVEETGLPKPTVHRMVQQLEGARLLIRQADGRQYGTGARLRRFAESLLLNSTQHGARHAILATLVAELGESCNVTALSGDEVVYLDRVETTEPLRFYLHPGSRVPAHCSASGKMILSQMTRQQRHRLLAHAPLQRHTPRTVVELDALEEELDAVRGAGYAVDNEEFLDGLVCVAVLVPSGSRRSNVCVAVQAPALRLQPEAAADLLPALQRAATAIGDIETEGASGPG